MVFVLLLAGARLVSAADVSVAPHPNVLFVMADDLNDWVGPLGNSLARTPHLDRLAQRATVFTRAYCSVPACAPSRTSLLTGIDAPTSGIYFNPQPFRLSAHAISRAIDLPRRFKTAGFLTAGFGKIFHHGRDQDDNRDSWTEGYYAGYSAARDAEHNRQALGSVSLGSVWPGSWGWYTDEWDRDDPKRMQQDTTNAIRMAELVKARHERPFFAAFGIFRPHSKWYVPKRYYDLYAVDSLPLPAGVREGDLDDVPGIGRWLAQINVTPDTHRTLIERKLWRSALQAYLASISYADAQLGRVLDALDAGPNARNTIIVFCSDHGYHLGEKEHWNKFTLWERSTRVPLLIAWPAAGASRPSRVETPVSLIDLYPTLLELAGLTAPTDQPLEGRSLRALLDGTQTARGAPVLTTYGRGNYAVRDQRWRYIRYRDGTEELYDHASDIHEWRNVAGDSQWRRVLERLRTALPANPAENSLIQDTSRAVFDPPF